MDIILLFSKENGPENPPKNPENQTPKSMSNFSEGVSLILLVLNT